MRDLGPRVWAGGRLALVVCPLGILAIVALVILCPAR